MDQHWEPDHAGWITPNGDFYPIGREEDESDRQHLDWVAKFADLVRKTGVDVPPDVHTQGGRVVGAMLARGWVRQANTDSYELNQKYRKRLFDYVMTNYPQEDFLVLDYVAPDGQLVGSDEVQLGAGLESIRDTAKRLFLEMGFGKQLLPEVAAQANAEIAELTKQYSDKYPGMIFHASLSGRAAEIYVQGIEVPKELRGRGIGSQAMQGLATLAKKYGLSISLNPAPESPRKRASLHRFYKRQGFGSKSSRKFYDPTARGDWIRPEAP